MQRSDMKKTRTENDVRHARSPYWVRKRECENTRPPSKRPPELVVSRYKLWTRHQFITHVFSCVQDDPTHKYNLRVDRVNPFLFNQKRASHVLEGETQNEGVACLATLETLLRMEHESPVVILKLCLRLPETVNIYCVFLTAEPLTVVLGNVPKIRHNERISSTERVDPPFFNHCHQQEHGHCRASGSRDSAGFEPT